MTDEDWLWLFICQQVKHDMEEERTCGVCLSKSEDDDRCIKCGGLIGNTGKNPNFDQNRFDKLKEGGDIDATERADRDSN